MRTVQQGMLAALVALAPLVPNAHAAETSNDSGVAVIIGNKAYQDQDVPAVDYAHNDADAFREFVVGSRGFSPDNVVDLRDATKVQMEGAFGTKGNERGHLYRRAKKDGSSHIVVFYSGHGVPGISDGRGYLLPVDANLDMAEINGYPIDVLYENLGKVPAKSVTVFLDACFSGGSGGGQLIRGYSPVYVDADVSGVAGLTVLTAASSKQVAIWDDEARHGLFTEHLLDALYGAADYDDDSGVSAAEAKRYLDEHMTPAARRIRGREQDAGLHGDENAVLSLASPGGWGSLPPRRVSLTVSDRAPSASVPSAPAPAPVRDTALETTFWESVKDGGAAGFEAYLQQYPDGAFAPLALVRLRERVWVPIENSTEPSVFEGYLASNPDGHFAELARAALRQRIEQADKHTLDSYLARHPRGSAANMARERLPTAAWKAIKASDDFSVFGDYLQQYPDSSHGAEARQRAAMLEWSTVANSLRMSDFDDFLRRHPNSEEASLVPSAKAALKLWAASTRAQFSTFKEEGGIWIGQDCPECPEVVVAPAGSYRMGSGGGDVRDVAIGAPFAVGKHEVTFAQWDACVQDRGCSPDPGIGQDRGWGRGQRPVIHVGWGDAQRYVQWLSGKTRKRYRLLSESEWEYVARGGTDTAYHWGDEIGVGRANCRGCGSQWDGRQTAPVGSFRANAWGLHDMHGNVSEWVEDCDPTHCISHGMRGGSWETEPLWLRAASRNWGMGRGNSVGFRVARDLIP